MADNKDKFGFGDRKVDSKIRQSFSHGRSKVVTVEIKKKRSFNKPDARGVRRDQKSAAETLAQKTGLSQSELERRLKAVQVQAMAQKLEAKRREETALASLNSKLADIEAAKKLEQKNAENLAKERAKEQAKEQQQTSRRDNKPAGSQRSDRTGGAKNSAFNKTNARGVSSRQDERQEGRSDGRQMRPGTGRLGSMRSGTERSGAERSGSERPGTGRTEWRKDARSGFARPKLSNEQVLLAMQNAPIQNDDNRFAAKKHSSNNDDDFSKNSKSAKKNDAFGKSFDKNSRLSIYNALNDSDDDYDDESESEGRSNSRGQTFQVRQGPKPGFRQAGKGGKSKQNRSQMANEEQSKVVREVLLPETITVQDLANRMAVRTGDLIKTLMKLGVMATLNQSIDADTAELVILELGHKVKRVDDSAVETELLNSGVEKREEKILPRPPIVTIMGHVDHGKTSLLDAIRKTDVALAEAGGITQHIGAYQISLHDGRKITFIDTPGHAAFTEMRARGANITDVVVLVVAADDGVKEQTVEAINHAKAAGVPILVAINKIDKPDVNPSKVRNELLSHGIVVESLGGDVIDVEVSAKSGLNLDKLEEAILLQAEMLELKADVNQPAEAVVIESKIEKGLGAVATILVKSGTLKVGDIFVSGTVFGKVRAIKNDLKMNMSELLPGSPAEIIGFNATPVPGDDFIVISSEQKAKEISDMRLMKKREKDWALKSRNSATSIAEMFAKAKEEGKMQILPIIVKGDVQGSIEAICESLKKLATDEVAVNILHSGVGEITESDVILANASGAIIVGFNVRANSQARQLSNSCSIDIKYYSVIYDLVDGIKSILSGMLAPELSEKVIGVAEIRKVFDVSRVGKIAGCMVVSGVIKRSAKVRLLRDNIVIHTGEVRSIQRKKDEAKEVKEGFECGVGLASYSDIRENDVLEFFEIEEIARSL